ncbi:MAG TPA: hypothetical protein VKA62_03900 [Agromyces sp.]|nr:hypothetical protein [Agromyces sp.]
MRLGTRWAFGGEPPASVPTALRARIADAEASVDDGAGGHWTLTWLEGRPIAELDDGTIVRDVADDGLAFGPDDTDDDW